MTSGDFEHRNRQRWVEYQRLTGSLENGVRDPGLGDLPRRFRELCLDLSLAETRMYGSHVTERLNALVIRGYEMIYRKRGIGWRSAVAFFCSGFPRAVRSEWRLFWLCNLVFWLPMLLMMFSSGHDLRWPQAVLGADGIASMERMYSGRGDQIMRARSEHGSNFMMFCYYIYNNVSIDFRIFAGGMLATLGSFFFLLFNGLYLGAAAGYVNHACDPESFWTYVAGHSPYELTGMIVSGMAGLRLGLAILRPGRLPRMRALVVASKRAMPLIYGAATLTVIAAVIEGFWSAQDIPAGVKYTFGGAGWVLIAVYLLLAGRGATDAA